MKANNPTKNLPIEYVEYLQSKLKYTEEVYKYELNYYTDKNNDLNWGTTIILALYIYIGNAISNTGIALYLNVFIGITVLLIIYMMSLIYYKKHYRKANIDLLNFLGVYKLNIDYLENEYRYNKIKDDKKLEDFADEIDAFNYEKLKDMDFILEDPAQFYISLGEKQKKFKSCLDKMQWTYYLCLSILLVFITIIPTYFIYIQYIKSTTV